MQKNPIAPFLESQGYLILDGGLSTQLESQGHDLDHPLWTARMLEEDPEALKTAHRAFLEAGADCIITASYQASMRGLLEAGYSPDEAAGLIEKSYALAVECRDEFYASYSPAKERLKPIVAASIGPYGAYLADGSEYRGDYGLSVDELVEFHRERFEILADCAELLAIETIPSFEEAQALHHLLSASKTSAWVSFSCKDGEHINDGTPIEDAVALFNDLPQVVAVGANCTAPQYVSSLIKRIKATCPSKEIVVYPNSGESFCATDKTWAAQACGPGAPERTLEWLRLGARLIGGCCRIRAVEIAAIRNLLGKGQWL